MITKMVGAVCVATAHRDPTVSFIGSKDRHSQVNAETVAKRFRCGIETAQKTLKATTQRGIRQAMHPLNRRYRVDHLNLTSQAPQRHFLYGHPVFKGKVTCRTYVRTTHNERDLYEGLPDGIEGECAALPRHWPNSSMTSASPTRSCVIFASEQTGKNTDVMRLIRRMHIKMRMAEKGRGITQNHRAEAEIREVKTKWKARMRSNQVPSRLWDYGLVYIAEIQSLLARGVDQRPGIERVTGNTVDISEWLDFDFFDRVWYWDQKKMDMTDEQARIGRWLGISHRVGSDMTYWILTESGQVIARSTVQHITTSDMATDEMKTRVHTFDSNLTDRLADDNFAVLLPDHVFYLQDDDDSPS